MSAEDKIQRLQQKLEYRIALKDITNKIHSARNIDEILVELKEQILRLFDADRITIYAVEASRKIIYSKFKSGEEISEIRLPISNNSIAGYVAYSQRLINIGNAYDDLELKDINPELKFDQSWDQKSGYKTTQILAAPIKFKKYLLGVIQLINKKSGGNFTPEDQNSLVEIAEILGIAFYNQIRMNRKIPGKFDYLVRESIITQRELEEAMISARNLNEEVETILIRNYKVSKENIGRSLSNFYKCKFVEFDDQISIPRDILAGLRSSYLKANLWMPIGFSNNKLIIVIDNPRHIQKVDEIKSRIKVKDIEFQIALKEDIIKYIDHFFPVTPNKHSLIDILGKLKAEAEEVDLSSPEIKENDSAIVQLVNKIINDAYDQRASDIHIETYPGKDNIQIRFRIDGSCVPYQNIPSSHRRAIISRIKIMSDLDIAERRLPQDGKIMFKQFGGRDIELRVAIVPTVGGNEDVVMRILAPNEPIPLNKIGMSEKNYALFKELIQLPYGIILVVGPSGSGKTTTLHSALGYINTPDKKIWTAEDPIEITQRGLRQVQVQPKIGFTFAAAMRAFLRADPDVIMLGEMRDEETAAIGIEASLTGHLVFSTLHTNSAPETIVRLLDMGIDPFNFADALLGILGQRLVKTLCPKCKEPYHPSQEEYRALIQEYGEQQYHKLNLPYTTNLVLYRAAGCEHCNHSGYRGRIGIHELLIGSDRVKKAIQGRARVEEIREIALTEGMITLKQDGIEKIFRGLTDIKQVRAVCIK
jgi:type II secretory ATPase GspE/PulE/Tfp pilus assembly ATPase PilB-like protein